MALVHLVAILAVIQFLCFGALVGSERRRSGLKAPAMTGDAGFERMYRVQMNTLELLVVFLPALLLAALYWPAYVVAGIGLVFIVGRTLYWRAYAADPAKRGLGFMLSLFPAAILAILALVGIVLSITGMR